MITFEPVLLRFVHGIVAGIQNVGPHTAADGLVVRVHLIEVSVLEFSTGLDGPPLFTAFFLTFPKDGCKLVYSIFGVQMKVGNTARLFRFLFG